MKTWGRASLVAGICLLAIAVAGCGAKDSPPSLPRSGELAPVGGTSSTIDDSGSTGTSGTSGSGPSTGASTSGASTSGGSSTRVTPEDERTFAYGTTDLAQLTKDTAALQGDASALSDALTARNTSDAKKAATAMESDATELSRDAKDAKKRMQPMRPSNAELVDAREACLTVYSLAGSYADTALSVADAVRAAIPAQLAASMSQASALVGTGQQLSSSISLAEKTLEAWARANPKEAAQALAKYGG